MTPAAETSVTAVLLALWRSNGALAITQLLADAAVSAPQAQSALNALEARGCRLERSPAGVRLLEPALACWSDVLEDEARRAGRALGTRVMVFSRTTSTNDVALQYADDPQAHGLVVLADAQTAGRGRLGHSWTAAAGQSVLMSVLLRQQGAEAFNRLTLLAGLAGARALEPIFDAAGAPGRSVEIKWPNDLLVDGRKIAGILVERPPAGGAAVVGVGINVHQRAEDFPPDIRGSAISARMVADGPLERLRIANNLLEELASAVETADAIPWLEEWKRRCSLLGRRVTVRCGGVTTSGYVVDISPLQGLILKDQTGAVRFFSAQTSSLL